MSKSELAERMTPLQVLIDAKLSGTTKHGDTVFHYSFRTNEQAAQVAVDALADAGYGIVLLNTKAGMTFDGGLDQG